MFVSPSRLNLWFGLILGTFVGLPALLVFVAMIVLPSCVSPMDIFLFSGGTATTGLWLARTCAYRLVERRYSD